MEKIVIFSINGNEEGAKGIRKVLIRSGSTNRKRISYAWSSRHESRQVASGSSLHQPSSLLYPILSTIFFTKADFLQSYPFCIKNCSTFSSFSGEVTYLRSPISWHKAASFITVRSTLSFNASCSASRNADNIDRYTNIH